MIVFCAVAWLLVVGVFFWLCRRPGVLLAAGFTAAVCEAVWVFVPAAAPPAMLAATAAWMVAAASTSWAMGRPVPPERLRPERLPRREQRRLVLTRRGRVTHWQLWEDEIAGYEQERQEYLLRGDDPEPGPLPARGLEGGARLHAAHL